MWTCPNCGREFGRTGQQHSCRTKSIEDHFRNKELAKGLFDGLFAEIEYHIGACRLLCLPCCVHLIGQYDFLAALPKKDRLEIRFALNRELVGARICQTVPVSKHAYKIGIDLHRTEDIDEELLNWLKESYSLKSV